MNARRIAAVVLRQWYLIRGSFSRILPLFAWVVIDIVTWGLITRYLNGITGARVNLVTMMLGAVLMWDFCHRIIHGVAMAFFEDVWSRNFLNFFATPMQISEYLTGLVVTGLGTSVLGLLAMIVVAAFYNLSFALYGLALLPFFLILLLFGIAIGIFGAGLVLRLGPAAEWFIWPIPALLAPFAAVFYPVAVMPAWMRVISRVVAPSYVFESMRAIVLGRPISMWGLVIAVVLTLAAIVLASAFFTAMYRYAVRTGLIARYSAETVA